MCFDVSQSIAKAPVILYNCHGMQGNQWWKYNVVSDVTAAVLKTLVHVSKAFFIF